MRILLINWQDPQNPRAGGAEIHLYEIFRRLAARGHTIRWLASGWPGCVRSASLDGLEITRTAGRYTFGLAVPRVLRRHLLSADYDVVVEALNKVPVYTPIFTRRPVALIVHHLFGTTAFREAALPLATATWLQERPIASVYRDVPIQAISESTADDLVARGLRRECIEVIHPGVDLDFFRPDPESQRSAEPTFVYLGRLQKYKRVDTILDAFAAALPTMPAARLLIAGKGDQETRLRNQAGSLGVAGSVDFLGYVSEDRKRELFRTAWANVFVSSKEGWGITNLEAGACRTPTIASNAPGLRESVIDGETGILVPPDDVAALAREMARVAGNRMLVEDLGAAALRFASSFTWDAAADATERHLLNIIGSMIP